MFEELKEEDMLEKEEELWLLEVVKCSSRIVGCLLLSGVKINSLAFSFPNFLDRYSQNLSLAGVLFI